MSFTRIDTPLDTLAESAVVRPSTIQKQANFYVLFLLFIIIITRN